MAYTYFERLSAMDAAFLAVEDECIQMHIGGVSIFESGPLAVGEDGIDIDRIRHLVAARLDKTPRFRQKLAYSPVSRAPVWIDDGAFHLDYHVRHTSLPHPGGMLQLERLASRVMSQGLDHRRPLWEFWFVEGLEGGRFAMISKIHHCMADGVSGVDLATAIVGPNPDFRPGAAHGWIPRPAPGVRELLEGDLRHRTSAFWELLRSGGGGSAGARPRASRPEQSIWQRLRDAGAALASTVETVPSTPLNVDVGPNRRFAWSRVDLERLGEIREAGGAKLNDVVLAIVSGTVRAFLERRGCSPNGIDFRATVPVNVRTPDEEGKLGNRVSQMYVHLPIDEEDPMERLRIVSERMTELKASGQIEGNRLVSSLLEVVPPRLARSVERMGTRRSVGNMVVTNVPGGPTTGYMIGAKLLESYPLVPLMPNQALNIAVLTYDGFLHWGFNADYDAIPDVDDFAALLAEETERLHKEAQARRSG